MAFCVASSPAHHCSGIFTTEQLRRRVASDEALLQAIANLSDSARLTVSNASRAVNEAQNALLAAHAWLASALATSESYRLEHLRLTEMVARSRKLLSVTPASLPDELVVQIAQLCVDEARESLEYTGGRGPDMEGRRGGYGIAWVYPMTLSQVCRRWRTVVLGSPRLWSYHTNIPPAISPHLVDLIRLRNGSCTVDVLWGVSPSSPTFSPQEVSASQGRWRALRILHPNTGTNALAIPFPTSNMFTSLASLFLTSSAHARPPVFSSSLLTIMPKLTKATLHDVQFLAPPPYRHPLTMDLSIRYTSIISFREKDMNDIAIVFPNLRRFSLHIRGPYLNRHARQTSHETRGGDPAHPSTSQQQQQLPFSFPELESLDISAKDLDHSLARFQGAFLPRLEKLQLRENALPAASTFFSHLVRARVPLSRLGLSDYSEAGSRIFRAHRGIRVLEVPFSAAALEIMRPMRMMDVPISLPSPVGAKAGEAGDGAVLAFPSVMVLVLSSPTEETKLEGSVGKIEGAKLHALAGIVKERNKVALGMHGVKIPSESPPAPPPKKSAKEKGKGKAAGDRPGDVDEPMTSADTLVNPPSSNGTPPKVRASTPPVAAFSAHGRMRERRPTLGGLLALPVLDVHYEVTRGVTSSRPASRRGRVAMEELYGAIVEGRKAWMRLGFDITGL